MRHRKAGSKFNRNSSHRKAMFRNMVTSLLKYDRIKTTDQKAKELRGWADHIITLAKRGDLHARRQAMAIVREKAVVHKVFEEAPKRFAAVSGGYTRVIKLGRRPGDAAMMSLIELVSPEVKKPKKKTAKKKAAAKKAPASAVAPKSDAAAETEAVEKTPAAEPVPDEAQPEKEPPAPAAAQADTAEDTQTAVADDSAHDARPDKDSVDEEAAGEKEDKPKDSD